MRSLFTSCSEDRLDIVGGRTYQRPYDLGRDVVFNRDGVKSVFLSHEVERDVRVARFDVIPPEGCKSVRVIVSRIPVVPDPQQTPLQEPDNYGSDDTRGQWILFVVSDVAGNLTVE